MDHVSQTLEFQTVAMQVRKSPKHNRGLKLAVFLLLTLCGCPLLLAETFQDQASTKLDSKAAQLDERVKTLESQVEELSDKYKQSAGFSDTEYVLRVQRHYEEYYEKVLRTQTNMMWAVGSLLTFLLGIAGFFSLRQFDRQIKFTALKVAAEQRVEFERRLETDLKELEMKNSKQVSDAITELSLTSKVLRFFDCGLIFAALKQYDKSIDDFRAGIVLYMSKRKLGGVPKDIISTSISNLFR